MSFSRRLTASFVAVCLGCTATLQVAQAGVIGTEQVARSEQPAQAEGHARLYATLDRADVAAALQARGVDIDEARARVAALTDDEAAHVAAQIDSAPAGAADALGVIVFIFVLLLITDILGFTKIFPFTRSVR